MLGNGITKHGAIQKKKELVLERNSGPGWAKVGQCRACILSRYGAYLLMQSFDRVDTRWQGLRNALAGIFCASLGSMDDQRTTSPADMFSPEGSLPSWRNDTSHTLRHATLPSEHVCTENLTPFLKLLPCKSLSGIAALLNPHKLFETNFHGMGIHVKWDEERGINVRLTFQMVSDPLRVSSINRGSFEYFLSLRITRGYS